MIEMQKVQWQASLYINKSKKIVIPGIMLEGCAVNGAKKLRLGNQAKAGIFVDSNPELSFDGDDLSIEDLLERDENRLTMPCRIQTAKVPVTRFKCEEWELTVPVAFEDSLFNASQLLDIFEAAGSQCGIGTWRPKHGRFYVES